jgi:hypothetical protein
MLSKAPCPQLNRTDHHASDANGATPDKAPSILYLSFEDVWPADLGDKRREYVAECDDALRSGWRNKI